MSREANSQALRRRAERAARFHAGNRPGDLLFHVTWSGRPAPPGLDAFLATALHERGPEVCLAPGGAERLVREYLDRLRTQLDRFYECDDDCVPCAIVYWGIGGVTAAMIGGEPYHDGRTSWLEPNLTWDKMPAVKFDADNQWVRFARDLNRALWTGWREDFMILPFLHRSPLDAANGLRGTDLFSDMYEAPEQVADLVGRCADWSVAMEEHLKTAAPRPQGAGTGVWGVWLPDDTVFVNGDPVGLVSRELGERFDRAGNERLFTGTGGGFFHNHTVGLHQVDLVSSYRGLHVQFFVNDPNQPDLETALLDRPDLRERIVAASLRKPVGGCVSPGRLDAVLEVASRGRFILAVGLPDGMDAEPYIRKLKTAAGR